MSLKPAQSLLQCKYNLPGFYIRMGHRIGGYLPILYTTSRLKRVNNAKVLYSNVWGDLIMFYACKDMIRCNW